MGTSAVVLNDPATGLPGPQYRVINGALCQLVYYTAATQLAASGAFNTPNLFQGEPVFISAAANGAFCTNYALGAAGTATPPREAGIGNRLGITRHAVTSAHEGRYIWVAIKGLVKARVYHVTSTLDSAGAYVQVLIEQSEDRFVGAQTGVAVTNEACLAIETTPTTITTATCAQRVEARAAADATGVYLTTIDLFGIDVDAAVVS